MRIYLFFKSQTFFSVPKETMRLFSNVSIDELYILQQHYAGKQNRQIVHQSNILNKKTERKR